jgi:hypothetical protein
MGTRARPKGDHLNSATCIRASRGGAARPAQPRQRVRLSRQRLHPAAFLGRFSPLLELSMQGEPPSIQGPCCREVIIEGQEQLPLQQECSAG